MYWLLVKPHSAQWQLNERANSLSSSADDAAAGQKVSGADDDSREREARKNRDDRQVPCYNSASRLVFSRRDDDDHAVLYFAAGYPYVYGVYIYILPWSYTHARGQLLNNDIAMRRVWAISVRRVSMYVMICGGRESPEKIRGIDNDLWSGA